MKMGLIATVSGFLRTTVLRATYLPPSACRVPLTAGGGEGRRYLTDRVRASKVQHAGPRRRSQLTGENKMVYLNLRAAGGTGDLG